MAEATPAANRFGHYIVQDKLGSGGMAVVYKAFNEEIKQTVALKILRASIMEQAGVVERFKLEAKIAERLRHGHIVGVYNHGSIKGRYFLELQYMSGGTLAERFEKPSEIGSQEVVRLLRNVASALDYAHKQGVIHRDLKLENVLLDNKGNAALSDFSIARLNDGNKLTATGYVVGTPMTIAPEQARGDAGLDYRADLYSLAVIAYVLAVGRYPFNGTNPLAILHQHLAEPVPPPSQVNPNVPKGLDAVLIRGLAKQPSDRYPSADMFVEAFARVVSDHKISSTIVDIRSDVAGNLVQLPPPQKADSADDLVRMAMDTNDKNVAIGYLKRALEIEPLHSKANRVLFQLEGAVPNEARRVKPAVPVSPDSLSPLKRSTAPASKHSNWYYAVVIGGILVAVSILFFLLSISGSPIPAQIANFLQGKQPVVTINGVPLKDVSNAVMQVTPQYQTTMLMGQKINDQVENGFSHAYLFDVTAGRGVSVAVWFTTETAKHVAKNVAVVDASGHSMANRCQFIKNTAVDTSVSIHCSTDQTGQWSVRVLGIQGESTGSYWVTVDAS